MTRASELLPNTDTSTVSKSVIKKTPICCAKALFKPTCANTFVRLSCDTGFAITCDAGSALIGHSTGRSPSDAAKLVGNVGTMLSLKSQVLG